MILFEKRACGILYNLLRSLAGDGSFLLPANVCPVVPLTFRKAGRPFQLIDIDARDLGMNRRTCLDVLARGSNSWSGVLYVHPYGARAEAVNDFFHLLRELRPGLLLIDDRCLCVPDCEGEDLAPCADVTLFSTGRGKPADLGFGGFAHCHPKFRYRRWPAPFSATALREVTRRYQQAIANGTPCASGEESWLDVSAPGLPWDAYRVAVREALPKAEQQRRRLNALYGAALPAEIQMPARFHGWRFQIRVPEPDRLVASLFAAGLFASRHYASLGGVFGAGRFPEAERLHSGIVNLFNDRYFDESRARRAAGVVRQHLVDVEARPAAGPPRGNAGKAGY